MERWEELVFYGEPATNAISRLDNQPCKQMPYAEKERKDGQRERSSKRWQAGGGEGREKADNESLSGQGMPVEVETSRKRYLFLIIITELMMMMIIEGRGCLQSVLINFLSYP